MGGAVWAVSGKQPDGGTILRTRTCLDAQFLLLGEACPIGLGQDIIVNV